MNENMVKNENIVKNNLEILVNVGPVEKRVAIVDKGKLVDFFLEREGLEHYVGSIYKGKVSAILPGIEAAFVDIGLEKNGFLHASDVWDKSSIVDELLDDDEEKPAPPVHKHSGAPKIDELLTNNQEIVVQVVKEAISTKGPRLTTYISLPGRYIVLTPYDDHIGISRRIREKEERDRIRSIITKLNLPKNTGCIVRTMAQGRTDKELSEELKYLLNLWKRVKMRVEKKASPVTVYEEYGAVLTTVRDKFTDDIDSLIVDSKEEFLRIMKFLKAFRPSLRRKVELYRGKDALFTKYYLDKQIDEIFKRKVFLKSGGYLVIEQTEGLVAIDVNTGSFTGKNKLEETAFKTNVESAREIPRQLLLRDIGGIVIIDFIDMEDRRHREKVFNILQQELRYDKAKISVRSISQFGIVEMTRQRMRKSLESTSHMECPYCEGKGVIKSAETIAIETARKIDQVLSGIKVPRKHLIVITHPDINVALMSDQAKMLGDIQRKYRCKIDFRDDSTLHREESIVKEK